ncbi:metallophosphoesterase [candidate division WWE3 bacterium]|uniref:Metallophosphoesterase n=1 Tax=candidate division WWE3 bacterium TaxID=2053526 RepID=A0A955LGF0_UNCKA|nr:metallophosphoesterase [candidate division WWE3 bacterium]
MTDQESLPELAVGGEYLGSVAIVSDSHSSFDTFSDVISRIEQEDVDLIIHLGDISAGGELEDLERMKAILDETGVEYEVLPGDHDFNWVPEHDLRNFRGVFGFAANTINRTRSYKGFNLVFYNNSDKTTGLDAAIDWLNDTLPTDATIQGRTILFTSTPIENPYFNDKKDPNGDEILKLLTTRNIKQVFSGDTHIFSRYKLGDTDIVTTTVGASGDYKNPLPQYVLVDFYANGDIDIKTKPAVEIESGD